MAVACSNMEGQLTLAIVNIMIREKGLVSVSLNRAGSYFPELSQGGRGTPIL